MRFRKSIKIAPGVKLNVSKSGISTTVGQRGLSTSLNKNGAYLNMGLPGTGLSQRTKIGGGAGAESQTPTQDYEPEMVEQAENKKINISEINDIPTLKKMRRNFRIAFVILSFLGIVSIPTVILPILFFIGAACVLFTAHTTEKRIKELEAAEVK